MVSFEDYSLPRHGPAFVTGLPLPSHQNATWYQSLAYVLSLKWSNRTASHRTSSAESGLGISGTPHYFYIMRTEQAFGFAVFLFHHNNDLPWPSATQGATPFDSGGLWHEKFHTRLPISTDQDKKHFFLCHQKSLSSCLADFRCYLTRNYDSLDAYVRGSPPANELAPIIAGPPNTSRAWTWELRIPSALMRRHVVLHRGFLSAEDCCRFSDWLWTDSGLPDDECTRIYHRIKENVTQTSAGESAFSVARDYLLGVKHT